MRDEQTKQRRLIKVKTKKTPVSRQLGTEKRGPMQRRNKCWTSRPKRRSCGMATETTRRTASADADEYAQLPTTPTKKAKLAKDASPAKAKRQLREGITDTEIEGTEEAKMPRAAQPVRNPFLVEPTSAGRSTSGPDKSMGATARGPPTTFGRTRAAAPERDEEQSQARPEQGQVHPQQPPERPRPQDITTMAQLAAMMQTENDAIKEAVVRKMDKIEEVQLQANRRITKVEKEVIKVETLASDAYSLAKKTQNDAQKIAENAKQQENRTTELERRMNEVEKLTKQGTATTSGGFLDDVPRNQRRVVVVAGFPPESRPADVVEDLNAKGIEFAEACTNFRRTTICKVRFDTP